MWSKLKALSPPLGLNPFKMNWGGKKVENWHYFLFVFFFLKCWILHTKDGGFNLAYYQHAAQRCRDGLVHMMWVTCPSMKAPLMLNDIWRFGHSIFSYPLNSACIKQSRHQTGLIGIDLKVGFFVVVVCFFSTVKGCLCATFRLLNNFQIIAFLLFLHFTLFHLFGFSALPLWVNNLFNSSL